MQPVSGPGATPPRWRRFERFLKQMRAMQVITVYGKGGSGKTTITSNLAILHAQQGRRVLLVGCDPKHDSTRVLTFPERVPTIISCMERLHTLHPPRDAFVRTGRLGITCIEAGGPEAGVGCAGRGIVRMFELLEEQQLFAGGHDQLLFDVLGDVVCGGFAAPLQQDGLNPLVLIVTSGTVMSLYAANNISRAVVRYQRNGVKLAGLVGNALRDERAGQAVHRFAEQLGTRVLAAIPESREIAAAERNGKTVVEADPTSLPAQQLARLAEDLGKIDPGTLPPPHPFSDEGLDDFFASLMA